MAFLLFIARGEHNTTVITGEYPFPRGTTQSTGVDYKEIRLRYIWDPVSKVISERN